MNNTKRLSIENRIALLKSRGTECGNIIKKLERQLRQIDKEG
jgi:hypothetical protein